MDKETLAKATKANYKINSFKDNVERLENILGGLKESTGGSIEICGVHLNVDNENMTDLISFIEKLLNSCNSKLELTEKEFKEL